MMNKQHGTGHAASEAPIRWPQRAISSGGMRLMCLKFGRTPNASGSGLKKPRASGCNVFNDAEGRPEWRNRRKVFRFLP
jgi:hypothetical protein